MTHETEAERTERLSRRRDNETQAEFEARIARDSGPDRAGETQQDGNARRRAARNPADVPSQPETQAQYDARIARDGLPKPLPETAEAAAARRADPQGRHSNEEQIRKDGGARLPAETETETQARVARERDAVARGDLRRPR